MLFKNIGKLDETSVRVIATGVSKKFNNNTYKKVLIHLINPTMKTISKENHKLWGYPLDYAHTTMVDGVLTSWYLKDNKVVRVNPQSKTIQ